LILDVDHEGRVTSMSTSRVRPPWPAEYTHWLHVFSAESRAKLRQAGYFPPDDLLRQAALAQPDAARRRAATRPNSGN
jgi:hypothetical protein